MYGDSSAVPGTVWGGQGDYCCMRDDFTVHDGKKDCMRSGGIEEIWTKVEICMYGQHPYQSNIIGI